jgi:hypothetical protein
MEFKLKSSNGEQVLRNINLGTSSPKLGGTVDISPFTNLNSLSCVSNGITGLTHKETQNNLQYLNLNDNALSGEFNLAKFPDLKEIDVYLNSNLELKNYGTHENLEVILARNTVINSFEDVSSKPELRVFDFTANVDNQYKSVSGDFPDFSNNVNLETIRINNTSLSATNPNFSSLNLLKALWIQNNILDGTITFPEEKNNLYEVNINRTNFTGGHDSLGDYPNLYRLFVSDNLVVTGKTPDFNNNPALEVVTFNNTSFTSVGSITGAPNLIQFTFPNTAALSGPFPDLSYNNKLQTVFLRNSNVSGNINSLSALNDIVTFNVYSNPSITGSIPDLSQCNQLATLGVYSNGLTSFDSDVVPSTLGRFEAFGTNTLNQTSINKILSAVALAGRNAGTRILNIGGTTNSAPDFTTDVYTITSARVGVTGFPAGSFVRPANSFTVTASVTGHNLSQGDIITLNNINSSPANLFNRTSKVETVIDANQFTFTVPISSTSNVSSTNSTIGRIRKSLTEDSVLYRYQQLALPNSLDGLGWTVTIRFP